MNELKELNLKKIDKEYLLEIFNKAIESNLEEADGKYLTASFVGRSSVKSTDDNLKGRWQATYILRYGDVYKIDIEFIEEDGNYLSDKKINFSHSDEILLNDINKLENNLLKDGTLNVSSDILKNYSNETNNDIKRLLNALQKVLNS